MEKYSEYKDSEIEWLGSIPNGWYVNSLKRIVKIKITDGPHETPEFVDKGVPFISAESIKNNKIDYNFCRGYISEELDIAYSKKCKPKVNDIFIVKSGSTTGKVAMVESDVDFNIWSPLALVRFLDIHDSRYMYYNLQSYYFQDQIKVFWSFGTQPNIGMNVLERLFVTLPPLKEQTQIANYLDAKTKAIDQKLNLLQQKITHYKAYRKTLINETVTKGLDKSVKLKDSGVEWIGEIPEHWEVKRIKDIFSTIAGGTPSTKEASYWIGDIPWIPSGAVQNSEINKEVIKSFISNEALLKSSTKMAKKDSILIALTGATCSNIGYLNFDTTINQSIVSIDSNHKKVSHRFYFYFLICAKEKIRTLMSGGAQGGINQGDVKYFKVCYTSKNEQQKIADFLDDKTSTIDKIVNNIETQISTLKELRKTLINEVVTGKVKVTD